MIHGNWHVHSIKALIAQLSKELYRKLDKDQKAAFLQCLDRIYDKKDLQHSAACLIDAKDSYDELRTFRKQKRLRYH
ncbi:hypothetical protein WR25_20078 [Diploscapter pachys]|uniref:Uncharacterized protein n=1 Tax=Diploscapter pachys TaxID=2018661 RepID=A0A2A2K710_9BILA|nr:hypothetical protein WR25_20078 [Diploscapter pachys]